MRLPETYNGLRLIHFPGAKVRLICQRGHYDMRTRASVLTSVRRGTLKCAVCTVGVTGKQLRVLRLLQRHQLEHGDGMAIRELNAEFGTGTKSLRETLEHKGLIELDDGTKCWLTDEGHDLLARMDEGESEAAE